MDIIFISSKDNRTLNFRIKSLFLVLTIVIFIILFTFFVYSIVGLTKNEVDRNRLLQLKQENKFIHQELARIEKEILSLNICIDSLELYDQKLRTYASLTPIDKDLRNMGVGGDGPDYKTGNLPRALVKNLKELAQTLDNLLARARLQKESSDRILTHLEEKDYLRDHTPSIIPVQGWLIRDFGNHRSPFTGLMKMHEGLDIAAPIGTPIIASADGTVRFAGDREGFGLTIEIDHGYGFTTLYAHCQRLKVTEGMLVKRGEIIGYVGNTGKSTGPHLHYEVRIAQIPINPINYIITAPIIID